MGELLHGWRRKAGCALFLMGVAFIGMWIRSYSKEDSVQLTGLTKIVSFQGDIARSKKIIEHRETGDFEYPPVTTHFMPYRLIVLPLMFVSVYLLVCKPQQPSKSVKETATSNSDTTGK
jgi:hypothetical protein